MKEPIYKVIKNSINIKKVAQKLSQNGYAHIKRKFYLKKLDKQQLETIQDTYKDLAKDTYSPGNRYRAYTKFVWNNESNKVVRDVGAYEQPKDYNPQDGGKKREFNQISDIYLNNHVINQLIYNNIEIAKDSNLVKFDSTLEIGLHQIRYGAQPDSPAYSSPMWLHKDSEPLVFVHLFNLTKNTLGGDNIIAYKNKPLNVLRLSKPLETLVVNKSVDHAVTPMGTSSKKTSYRDILLVTFFNNPDKNPQKNDSEKQNNMQKEENTQSTYKLNHE